MLLKRNVLCLAAVLVLLGSMMAPNGFAQTASDKRTLFTFSGPVRMPGRTLPAGQYLFRLLDTNVRGIVQVLSNDGTKLYGTFFTISALRLKPADQPEVHFLETPSGAAPAIRTWWYPGESTGFEFIYPKDDARRLAKSANQSVLTTQAQTSTTAETDTKNLSRIGSTGTETNVDSAAKPVAATPAGDTLKGEVAAPTLAIPASPQVVNPEPEKK